MTKSFIRTLLAALGAAALFGTSTTASAAGATLTFNDPNCASFSITGSFPNFTLNCGSLTCTATASPTTPLPGAASTLTGNCTGGGTVTYAWTSVTGGTCPAAPVGNVASGNVTSAVAQGPCVYKVTGTDPALLSGTATASVTWSATPPAAPSGCTLAAVPGSLPVGGGNVTFTATCSGGGAPTNHAWTGAGVVTPTVPGSQIVNVTASGTYTVTPSNAGGNGNVASASVTVAGAGISCSGFTKTVNVDMGWPPYSSLHTQDYGPGGFGAADALVIHIRPPAGSTSPAGTSGSLKLYEYASPTSDRFAVLSTSACDWNGISGWLDANKIPLLVSLPAGNPNSTILLNLIQVNRQDSAGYVKLLPGVDYYLNIKNTHPDGTPSCPGGSNCNMIIEWTPPPGT